MKWKDALLLSSMPLEFETGRFLVDQGFAVNSDFRYTWKDFEIINDSAIDIYAKANISSSELINKYLQIELLIDCKHRSPDTVGLFLPDINLPGHSFTSGNTIRMIDQFSPYVIDPDTKTGFESDLLLCYKGMEIDLETGDINDLIYKKGLSKLQNALPRLFSENIMTFLAGPPEENIPFLFCPILLTTAPLYVMKKNISLEEIRSASEVKEVGIEVPFLVMRSDISPGFKSICIKESSCLKEIVRTDNAMSIEMRKARYYNSLFNLPFTIIDAFNSAEYFYLNTFFTQFIVCNNKEFPLFINSLKQTAKSAFNTIQRLA
ncbi:Uncharacterized protein dnl_29150 [Desulfonema limicola]|uniref:Uncharacterized protein n=1 Tax=Desulfonema limicola TaxID=45656 RepID=A0A975B834_9BACT|nr:hypothetical protein [Desulfonema limicola]QTA80605.1 Uncharacterized protein dnl_29150 [Desulfonema limicola]